MAEIAPAGGGGPNRLFIVLAIGLAVLLVLGLVGLGGLFFIRTAFAPPPPTVRIAAATPTRVLPTPPPPPTATPAPTEIVTPTLVLSGGGTGTVTPATPTATTTAGTPAGTGTPGTGTLPQSGLGEDLMLLAGGIVLVMVVFAARRARSA